MLAVLAAVAPPALRVLAGVALAAAAVPALALALVTSRAFVRLSCVVVVVVEARGGLGLAEDLVAAPVDWCGEG